MKLHSILLCLLLPCNAFAFTQSPPKSFGKISPASNTRGTYLSSHHGSNDGEQTSNRRHLLTGILTSLTLSSTLTLTQQPQEALAFDNKISNKYDDRPKRRGPQPKDLGVRTRKDMVGEEYAGLKPCGAAPNCFCSTDDVGDDPEHSIPSWKYPSSLDREGAFLALERTVKAYKPGQGNIDGGGFQVVSSDPAKGYMYIQFESLKNGYIDDVEFAHVDGLGDRAIQVRSSSRVGYLDFGVNAKRLNYIAKALKEEGWDAPGVDPATHQDYVAQNSSA